jgi:hypothetical protein
MLIFDVLQIGDTSFSQQELHLLYFFLQKTALSLLETFVRETKESRLHS